MAGTERYMLQLISSLKVPLVQQNNFCFLIQYIKFYSSHMLLKIKQIQYCYRFSHLFRNVFVIVP